MPVATTQLIDDVDGLRAVLSARLVGVKVPGFTCGCGSIHCAEGQVASVDPPENGSEPTKTFLWHISVAPTEPGHAGWSTGLDLLSKDELRELFDESLARTAAIREALGQSLSNWMVGRYEEGSPDGFASGRVAAVECSQWQSSELPHIWEARVVPLMPGPREWKFSLADRGVNDAKFQDLIEELDRRLTENGTPLQPMSADEVEQTFTAAAEKLAQDRDVIENRLRSRYMGQRHEGYLEQSSRYAPGRITAIVCDNEDMPHAPYSWVAVITPNDRTKEPWLVRMENLVVKPVLERVMQGKPSIFSLNVK